MQAVEKANGDFGDDWTPDADGLCSRKAARVVLIDPEGRVLLVHGHDIDDSEDSWWFTVGGGLGEDRPREGAVRELHEETGLQVAPSRLTGPVLLREEKFYFAARTVLQNEQFFLLYASWEEVNSVRPGYDLTALEQETLDEFRWWSLEEIRAAQAEGETFYPAAFPDLLETWWPRWDGVCRSVVEGSVDDAGG